MAWRLARSLVVLRNEVRTLHPGTTVWDIGDEDHQASASDHNPNPADVVCATDTLPNAGLNLSRYAEAVRQAGLAGHPAPKYVIFDRRIASRNQGWRWRTYNGLNPHTGHVHVSVGVGPDGRSTGPYDDDSPWGLLKEGDVELNDPVNLWDEAGNKPWRAGGTLGVTKANPTVRVEQLLQWGGEVGHLMHGKALPALARIEALLKVIAGQDPATAVREEIAKLATTLVAAVVEAVPDAGQATVEAALRSVLGELDEG